MHGVHTSNKRDKRPMANDKLKFRNVGLLLEDHDLLRKIAAAEQRTMARQLSVIIREAHERMSAED